MKQWLLWGVLVVVGCAGEQKPPPDSAPIDPSLFAACQATGTAERLSHDGSIEEVIRGGVVIKPGQTLCLELDVSAEQGVETESRLAKGRPHVQLRLSYSDMGTTLEVLNRTDFDVRYGAGLRATPNGKWQPTPVLPLRHRFTAFELWPERLDSVMVYGFAARKAE